VVHGGGLRNHYNYCGNSPYIYVDPDGNDFGISAIIGAIVGAVVGAASAAAAGGDAKAIVISAMAGAVIGAVSGGVGAAVEAAAISAGASAGAAAISGAAAAAGVTATAGMVQTATTGGSASQVLLAGAVSSAAGMISGGIGVATSSLGRAGSAIVNYVASVGVSYGTTAISGGLNEDTWDDVLLSSSISYWTSYVGSAVGAEVENVEAGGRGEDPGSQIELMTGGPPPAEDGDGSFGNERKGPPAWDTDHWKGQDVVLIVHTKDMEELANKWKIGLEKAGANVTLFKGKGDDFSYEAYMNWAKGHQGKYDTALVFAHGDSSMGGRLLFGSASHPSSEVCPGIDIQRFKEYSASLLYLTKENGTVGFYACNLGRGQNSSFLNKFYDYSKEYPGTGKNVHGFKTEFNFDKKGGSGIETPLSGWKESDTPVSIFNWNKYN